MVELEEVKNKYADEDPKTYEILVKAPSLEAAKEGMRAKFEKVVHAPYYPKSVEPVKWANSVETFDFDLEEPWYECDIIAFDVETTGLDPREDRIIQFGMAKYDQESKSFKPHETFFVNNEGVECDYDAQEVHGIDPEQYREAPSFMEQFNEYIVDYFNENTIWVAQNKGFDWSFLMTHLEDYPDPVPRCLCSYWLAQNTNHDADSESLDDLSEYLDVTLDDHHDALADAVACGEVFLRFCRRNPETRQARTMGELFEVFDSWRR